MAAIFVVALTVPEAWQDAPGGLNGPLVLVGAYLLVRCVHLPVYAVAATDDRGLRRQLAITSGPLLASAALLIPGVLLGGSTQTLLFAAALVVDWVGVWLISRHGNWRLHSAGHWTERHGEFIILALGESVVAIGVGAATQPISAPLLLAAGRPGAHHGRPDRRRDHPVCAGPTQPPRRIVPSPSTWLSACALRRPGRRRGIAGWSSLASTT
jgi:Bacterial low temperature requirement A protein (LtrA)